MADQDSLWWQSKVQVTKWSLQVRIRFWIKIEILPTSVKWRLKCPINTGDFQLWSQRTPLVSRLATRRGLGPYDEGLKAELGSQWCPCHCVPVHPLFCRLLGCGLQTLMHLARSNNYNNPPPLCDTIPAVGPCLEKHADAIRSECLQDWGHPCYSMPLHRASYSKEFVKHFVKCCAHSCIEMMVHL